MSWYLYYSLALLQDSYSAGTIQYKSCCYTKNACSRSQHSCKNGVRERLYWNENPKVNWKVEKGEVTGESSERDDKESLSISFTALAQGPKLIIV